MEATKQNTAVIEAPAAPALDLNVQQLPGIAQPTDAEIALALEKAMEERRVKEANAIVRFDSTIGFKLEGQVIGAGRKVNKAGAVRVSMGTKKEMGLASGGMKGTALEDFTRMNSDKLKEKQSMLAARLAGDNQWTGSAYVLSAKGDKITLEYKKAPAMTVTVAAEPTDEMIAKVLGKTVEQVKAMKLEAKNEADAKDNMEKAIRARVEAEIKAEIAAKVLADDNAAKELAAEELARIAKSANNNGAVGAPEPSDNDGAAE